MPKHASTQTDTRFCTYCTHYYRPIEGTDCQSCMRDQGKPAWELMTHTPKFKVGDKVRSVSDALGKFLPIGAEGTVLHVRALGESLNYPYHVDYSAYYGSPSGWGAREEWLEAVEPAKNKNLGGERLGL